MGQFLVAVIIPPNIFSSCPLSLFVSFTHFLIISLLPHFPIASYQIKWDVLSRMGLMCCVGQHCVCVCVHICGCTPLCVCVCTYSMCRSILYVCAGCSSSVYLCVRDVLVLLLRVMKMSFYQHFLAKELSEY